MTATLAIPLCHHRLASLATLSHTIVVVIIIIIISIISISLVRVMILACAIDPTAGCCSCARRWSEKLKKGKKERKKERGIQEMRLKEEEDDDEQEKNSAGHPSCRV